jgi:hypothetical protein
MSHRASGQLPINLTEFLKGVDIPANRNDLRGHARRSHAEKEVLRTIELIPRQEYSNMAEMMMGRGYMK